jgi:hypothetical protein
LSPSTTSKEPFHGTTNPYSQQIQLSAGPTNPGI